MKKMTLVSFWIIASSCVGATADGIGTIRGTALGPYGEPIPGATIFAFLVSESPRFHLVESGLTDANGVFSIENLPVGKFRIETMKEEDGYPRTYADIYRVKNPLLAEITQDKPDAFVQVKMGPKAAVISGRTIDSETGEPVLHAMARLWRPTDPDRITSIGLKPNFRVLMPPGEDIAFEIVLEGRDSWRISEFPLHLTSGSVMNLDAQLRKTTAVAVR